MKPMTVNGWLLLATAIGMLIPATARAQFDESRVRARLPAQELAILKRVADKYRLTPDQRALLYGTRILENGRLGSGIEMGVGQEQPGHRARRYAGNWRKSLELQAIHAAGTIKRRYRGDLQAYARRWCPRKAAAWAGTMRELLKGQGA